MTDFTEYLGFFRVPAKLNHWLVRESLNLWAYSHSDYFQKPPSSATIYTKIPTKNYGESHVSNRPKPEPEGN